MGLDFSAMKGYAEEEELGLDLGGNESTLKKGEEVAQLISINLIQPGKYQPREGFEEESLQELADSIKAQGVLLPILIRPIENGQYEIIAGERRWRASKLAGKDTVPSIIRDVNDQTALAMALVENIQREDLLPMEEANALQKLKDEFKLKNKEVAEIVGKKANEVSRLLSLLKLPDCLKELYERGITSQNVLNELSIAYKDNPEETGSFVFDKDAITVKEAREFKDRNKIKDDSKKNPMSDFSGSKDFEHSSNSDDGGGDENKEKKLNENSSGDDEIDQGELTSWPKGKAISDPDRMTKPLLIVEFEGRSASVLLNRRPSNAGLIRIRYEDGGGDIEVDAAKCKINLLTEN